MLAEVLLFRNSILTEGSNYSSQKLAQLKTCVDMLAACSLYQECFEEPYLDQTVTHY